MNSRGLEDAREKEFIRALAGELGITADELQEVLEEVLPDEIDGFAVGFIVNFRVDADPSILAKVQGLGAGQYTLNIGNVFENEPDDED
ncbi:hypothetical protein J2S30_003743 [Herbaspirillum rubrisubalbicans]|uniref:hypothetical protein n=1 Tax=Herbaspirillum rubrisubalbicans TaxID=80842 RepID=UPI0020A1987E|nr:hypothetical protein [Herbaspirillum rubrisubalbicans]MCP1575364.1 hypothetical protein [Herbaspirillum rubrisubalbicans]